jgi:branched-chain amino acid transport system permease protein
MSFKVATSERIGVSGPWLLILLALALPWGVDMFGQVPAYILNLSAIFSIVSVALNLLTGYSGQVSLGHAGFLLVGEYVSALLTVKLGLTFWLALPLTGIFAGLLGLVIGLPAVRLSGNLLAIATLGFGLAVPEVILKWSNLTNGATGLSPVRPHIGSFPLNADLYYYYLIFGCLVFEILVVRNLLRQKTGRAWQAIRDRERAAVSVGISVERYKVTSFMLSAGFSGIAGSLYAHYLNFVSPGDFSMEDSFMFLAMIVLGGLGSIGGAVLGAVLLTIIEQVSGTFGHFSVIIVGAVMLLSVLFFPGGLISAGHSWIARVPVRKKRLL